MNEQTDQERDKLVGPQREHVAQLLRQRAAAPDAIAAEIRAQIGAGRAARLERAGREFLDDGTPHGIARAQVTQIVRVRERTTIKLACT